MEKYLLFYLLVLTSSCAYSQGIKLPDVIIPPSAFVIGQPTADFTVAGVQGFSRKSYSPSMSRGKWVLLHFFGLGCSSSFTHFRKLDTLYRQNKDRLDVIMLGKLEPPTAYSPDLRDEYRQFQVKYNLQQPVAYSAPLFKELGIPTVPYDVLIDPDGFVRQLFFINIVSRESIEEILSGKKTSFPSDIKVATSELPQAQYHPSKPLHVDENGGEVSDFLFRSLLTPAMSSFTPNPVAVQRGWGRGIQFTNQPLKNLIYLAFGDTISRLPKLQPNSYQEYCPAPVWEFTLSSKDSLSLLNSLYCYSLHVPVDRPDPYWLQQMMQQDLQRYFGLQISVETREMPVYKMVLTGDKKRLLSKGGPSNNGYVSMGKLTLKNVPVSVLVEKLWGRYQSDTVFVDATGITENIDVTVDALLDEPLEKAIQSLRQSGIDIRLTNHPMKVFVVRRGQYAAKLSVATH